MTGMSDVFYLYESGLPIRQISVKTNISRYKVRQMLVKGGYYIRTSKEGRKLILPHINHNAFSIVNSHEVAYWIGFLAADGNIYKNRVKIMLAERDTGHIMKFKEFLKSKYKICKNITNLNGKKFVSVGFGFTSEIMTNHLERHGIVPNKSKTLTLSKKIPDKFINSYVLGLCDGDGCFSVGKTGQITFVLTASKNIAEEVQSLLIKNCGVSKTKIRQYKHSPCTFSLVYHGNKQVKNIVQFLYNEHLTCLDRKKILVTNHFSKLDKSFQLNHP